MMESMQKRTNRRRHLGLWAVLTVLVLYVGYTLLRPLPTPTLSFMSRPNTAAQAISLPWPNYGQSAVGAVGYGLLASSGTQKTFPIASVAKVLTALSILQQKPLKVGEQGPTITLTAQDVQFYQNYVAIDGSVVPVTAGEQITEYQALQAMMLPSANNMAQSLATWAFGSEAAYVTYANNFAPKLGMTNTHIADASGFSPNTTSTASDLVRLGLAALDNTALATIVGQTKAVLPGAGTVYNVNALLGQDGIIGIKTGNTDQAGGCFLSASDKMVGDKLVRVVTAIEAAPNLGTALHDTLPLVQAMPAGFTQITPIKAGQQLGTVTSAWGASASVVAAKSISFVQWRGSSVSTDLTTAKIGKKLSSQEVVGSMAITSNQQSYNTNLVANSSLAGPSLWWRLTHFN